MATIAVIAHPNDGFHAGHYLVQGLFPHWIEAGHMVVVADDIERMPSADIALLHVDLTVVPPEIMSTLDRYPLVLNGATRTIAKRSISQHLLAPTDQHSGPVIIKTDANCGGLPELRHARIDAGRGRGPAVPPRVVSGRYPILDSLADVPAEIWRDPSYVVEKFLPERDERGYCLRAWVFFGDRERCTRYLASSPVVKAADILEREPCAVPDELRGWRERLGFEYGKFDFGIHEGRPVLYDVNRTPTVPATLSDALAAGMAHLAAGIERYAR